MTNGFKMLQIKSIERHLVKDVLLHLRMLGLSLGVVFCSITTASAQDTQCNSPSDINGQTICSDNTIKNSTNGSNSSKPASPAKISGKGAYKGTFYENDFHYLDDATLSEHDARDLHSRITDKWKNLSLSSNINLDLGGEFRTRFQSDNNGALNQPSGLDNNFFLTRLRAYANVEIGEHIRVFGEVIDARAQGVDTLNQLPVAEAPADIRNAFVELHAPLKDGEVYVRGGRQELSFGSQRFVSPLDWANARRSFEGVRVGYKSETLELSAWRTRPQLSNGIFDTDISDDITFSGVYGTYHVLPDLTFDGFVFNLNNDENIGNDSNIWTIGWRSEGRANALLWEVEIAKQTGQEENLLTGLDDDFESYAVTAGVGWDFSEIAPVLKNIWLYYDLAQGDDDPNDGKVETFNQLFPLAHAYFGHIDFVGRRNVESLSLRALFKPHKRMSVSVGGHQLWRETTQDALFSAGGAAIRPALPGSRSIGQEIDLDVSVSLTQRAALSAGYSRFFSDSFIEAGNPADLDGAFEFSYAQIKFQF